VQHRHVCSTDLCTARTIAKNDSSKKLQPFLQFNILSPSRMNRVTMTPWMLWRSAAAHTDKEVSTR